MKKVYTAVFTSQDREFDEFGKGYLPLFDSVFGIYEDMWDAISAVCDFLHSNDRGYEVVEDARCSDGEGHTIGWTYTFRYEDKNTGAFALYEMEISEHYITPKKN